MFKTLAFAAVAVFGVAMADENLTAVSSVFLSHARHAATYNT